MKLFIVLLLCVVIAPLAVGQTVVSDKVWVKHYGAATFKADSVYVSTSNAFWVTVTISLDTTASAVIPYFCKNNDSTQEQPLVTAGDSFTWDVFGLKFFRVKGAVPVTVRIVPKVK